LPPAALRIDVRAASTIALVTEPLSTTCCLSPIGTAAAELEALAQADEKVQLFLTGKLVVKIVTVPDKLINLVVK